MKSSDYDRAGTLAPGIRFGGLAALGVEDVSRYGNRIRPEQELVIIGLKDIILKELN